MNKRDQDKEFEQMELDLISSCDWAVRCINCGDITMYANPTYFEGDQLPDMICLRCKKERIGNN